jgi:hypothetical protein
VAGGVLDVDVVVADAEAGHELEPGKPCHHRGGQDVRCAGDGGRPDARPDLGDQGLAVRRVRQDVQRDQRRELVDDELPRCSDQ